MTTYAQSNWIYRQFVPCSGNNQTAALVAWAFSKPVSAWSRWAGRGHGLGEGSVCGREVDQWWLASCVSEWLSSSPSQREDETAWSIDSTRPVHNASSRPPGTRLFNAIYWLHIDLRRDRHHRSSPSLDELDVLMTSHDVTGTCSLSSF